MSRQVWRGSVGLHTENTFPQRGVLMNIVDAAVAGDRLETLKALRRRIAQQIDSCESGRDMASLSKRLIEVMDEIDIIEAADNPDDIDSVFNEL